MGKRLLSVAVEKLWYCWKYYPNELTLLLIKYPIVSFYSNTASRVISFQKRFQILPRSLIDIKYRSLNIMQGEHWKLIVKVCRKLCFANCFGCKVQFPQADLQPDHARVTTFRSQGLRLLNDIFSFSEHQVSSKRISWSSGC